MWKLKRTANIRKQNMRKDLQTEKIRVRPRVNAVKEKRNTFKPVSEL